MNILPIPKKQLLDIATTYGTPTYVYNAKAIKYRVDALSNAFAPFSHRIYFASKALTNINVLHLLHSKGAYLDCVSINEVLTALSSSVPPEKILYTPSMPHFKDIEKAVELNVHLHIDSLATLEKFGKRFGGTKGIGIRINPELAPSGGTLSISTAHIDSKFGIAISYLDLVLDIVKRYNIRIVGLHQHSGSDVKDATMLLKGLQVLEEASVHFPDLEYFDIGGGFKVPYYENDVEIDLEKMSTDLQSLFRSIQQKHKRPISIWFELGKYLVSQSGYLLTRVNEIKQTPTKQFIGVDTGFHHLIRPSLYDAYHYMENISADEHSSQYTYDIVGILCETDTLGEERKLPLTQEGDIIAIHNAGAYGYGMASNFNSHVRPAEVLVDGEKIILIRERENFDDLLKGQIKTF